MICTTLKAGADCAFMTKAGCGYSGGACQPVVEQCEGCHKVMELPSGKFCSSYPNPFSKWRSGHCNFATHSRWDQNQQQARINPLKASKRSTKRK